MRKLTTILISLGLIAQCYSQQKDPTTSFGKVTPDELRMKQCEFEKSAPAMVLFDVCENYGSLNIVQDVMQFSSEITRHVRIKIFSDKGFGNADTHIAYATSNDEIRNLDAQTYNLDEKGNMVITKVEKKLIYDKKLVNKFLSDLSFTFPDVRPGSVLEFRYTMKSTGLKMINRWNFQGPIPVQYSRFVVSFPEEFVVSVTPKCTLPVNYKSGSTGTKTIETYVMETVPSLNPEPYMTSVNDYLQHLEPNIVAVNYRGMHTDVYLPWPILVKQLLEHEDFGQQLKKDIPRTSELDDILKKLSDPYQKLTTIYYYVRNYMTWDGINTIWAPDGIKEAWKNKKGTAGEINLILVNLLKDAGLTAQAVLVSTKDNGKINATLADTRQFNKVMAYVMLGDKVYVLDATDKYTPPGLIPPDVCYTDGLLLSNPATMAWGWKNLWNSKQRFRNYTLVKANFTDKGELSGTVKITSMEYARIPRAISLKKGRDKFMESYFTSPNPGVKLDGFTIENENADSLPLVQSFSFVKPGAASGDYGYFNLNMFSGLEKNQFIAQNRVSDIFFGSSQLYYISGSFTVPDNYTFDVLPESVQMITPDTSIIATRRLSVNGNELGALLTVEFRKPVFTAEEYPDLMEFYKKMFDMLNEQIVIKKK